MLSVPISLKENGTATILPLHINRRNALNPLSNPKVPLFTWTKRSTLTPPPDGRMLNAQKQTKGIPRCAKLSSPSPSLPLPSFFP